MEYWNMLEGHEVCEGNMWPLCTVFSVITDPRRCPKLSVISKVSYIRCSVKLCSKITFKSIQLQVLLFSVLLHMDMNRYIVPIQKQTYQIPEWLMQIMEAPRTKIPRCSLHYAPTYVFYNILKSFKPSPPIAQQSLGGQGLIIMASWSHSDAPHFCSPPLDEGSARRRDLYLTTHSSHKRETSVTRAGLELLIPAYEQPRTHVLDRVVSWIGQNC
jgi:hypothetical protein